MALKTVFNFKWNFVGQLATVLIKVWKTHGFKVERKAVVLSVGLECTIETLSFALSFVTDFRFRFMRHWLRFEFLDSFTKSLVQF
jgi:hypothetical protein